MKYTLATNQITQKTTSALEVPLCELTIVRTNIHIQILVTHIIMYGTMAEKPGATLKGGTCTSLLICRIWQDKTIIWSFVRLALWAPNTSGIKLFLNQLKF